MVNSTHPDYDAALPAWLRARDVVAGEDAVKAAGDRYLPRLDSQRDEDFAAYKQRALFFNATARTADGFVGLIFRREPTIKIGTQNPGLESRNPKLEPVPRVPPAATAPCWASSRTPTSAAPPSRPMPETSRPRSWPSAGPEPSSTGRTRRKSA